MSYTPTKRDLLIGRFMTWLMTRFASKEYYAYWYLVTKYGNIELNRRIQKEIEEETNDV